MKTKTKLAYDRITYIKPGTTETKTMFQVYAPSAPSVLLLETSSLREAKKAVAAGKVPKKSQPQPRNAEMRKPLLLSQSVKLALVHLVNRLRDGTYTSLKPAVQRMVQCGDYKEFHGMTELDVYGLFHQHADAIKKAADFPPHNEFYDTVVTHVATAAWQGGCAALVAATVASLTIPVFDLVRGQELAKRILTVAAVAKLPVLFVGPEGSSKGMLVQAAAELGVTAHALRAPATKTMSQAWVTRWNRTPAARRYRDAHTLTLELCPVTHRDMLGKVPGTTLAETKARITRGIASAFTDVETFRKFVANDDSLRALLKQATEELHLLPSAYEMVARTAYAIAALEGEKEYKLTHLCEAIQYALIYRMPR